MYLAFWYCYDFMVNLGNLTHTLYHEANTWVLLLLIPLVGSLILLVFLAKDSQPGSNAWGDNPKELTSVRPAF